MNKVSWAELVSLYPSVTAYAFQLKELWKAPTHDWQQRATFPTHIQTIKGMITLEQWVNRYA